MFDGLREYGSRVREIVAGVDQPVDLAAVLGPLLDLVEVALFREGVQPCLTRSWVTR